MKIIIILIIVFCVNPNVCLNCSYVDNKVLEKAKNIHVKSTLPKLESPPKHNTMIYSTEQIIPKFCTRHEPILTLKTLSLCETKTEEFGKELFKNYNLYKFICLYNNIKVIRTHTFFNVTLRQIELLYNDIRLIEEGAFEDLKFLKVLDLSNNKIARINSKMFVNLLSLYEFLLSGNLLKIIAFSDLDFLRGRHTSGIYLDNNTIEVLQSKSMSNLMVTTLSLQQNHLIDIMGDVFQGSCIEVILIGDNNLSSLSQQYLNTICNLTEISFVLRTNMETLKMEQDAQMWDDITVIAIFIWLVITITIFYYIYYKIHNK